MCGYLHTESLEGAKTFALWPLAGDHGKIEKFLRKLAPRAGLEAAIPRFGDAGTGVTVPGELARVTGSSRPDAGRGNPALVAEGYATRIAPGTYRLVAASVGA